MAILLREVDILLVEDNPADARLVREALLDNKLRAVLHHVEDGVEALDFLRHLGKYRAAPRPDLILLDLNLPRKNGRETLADIKSDPALSNIPVVILSGSQAQEDIARAYDLKANCYVTKPLDFEQFLKITRSITEFWLTIVSLPPAAKACL